MLLCYFLTGFRRYSYRNVLWHLQRVTGTSLVTCLDYCWAGLLLGFMQLAVADNLWISDLEYFTKKVSLTDIHKFCYSLSYSPRLTVIQEYITYKHIDGAYFNSFKAIFLSSGLSFVKAAHASCSRFFITFCLSRIDPGYFICASAKLHSLYKLHTLLLQKCRFVSYEHAWNNLPQSI